MVAATEPATAIYPAIVVTNAGRATGAVSKAADKPVNNNPIFLTVLKKGDMGAFQFSLICCIFQILLSLFCGRTDGEEYFFIFVNRNKNNGCQFFKSQT